MTSVFGLSLADRLVLPCEMRIGKMLHGLFVALKCA